MENQDKSIDTLIEDVYSVFTEGYNPTDENALG